MNDWHWDTGDVVSEVSSLVVLLGNCHVIGTTVVGVLVHLTAVQRLEVVGLEDEVFVETEVVQVLEGKGVVVTTVVEDLIGVSDVGAVEGVVLLSGILVDTVLVLVLTVVEVVP